MRNEVFSGTDEFLRWVFEQEVWIELEDGRAVSMPESTQARSVIAANLVCSLAPSARRRGIRVTGRGTAVVTGDLTVRFPAVVVDAGAPDPSAIAASDPILIAEMRTEDDVHRVAEYREVPGIETIVMVDPARVEVELHRRVAGSWIVERLSAPDDVLSIGRIDAAPTMRDLYETVHPPFDDDLGAKTF